MSLSELSNDAKYSIKSEIEKNLIKRYSWLLAVFGLSLGIVASLLSSYISDKTSNVVKKELSKNISSVEIDVDNYKKRFESVLSSAKTLENKVNDISKAVNTLTTEEIASRLKKVDGQIESLSKQLEALQMIINPKKAPEILNVASMAKEIQAREELEKKVFSEVGNSAQKILKIEDHVRTLQYWIWGTLVTFIGGLFGTLAYLGKRLLPSQHREE
jgi:septal ring factor EnvC (AmiA/AmiB activator)